MIFPSMFLLLFPPPELQVFPRAQRRPLAALRFFEAACDLLSRNALVLLSRLLREKCVLRALVLTTKEKNVTPNGTSNLKLQTSNKNPAQGGVFILFSKKITSW
jgi:hypothetical protein